MSYKILIEPAKSSKSTCHNCKHTIDSNTLRIKVVDARKFNQYIRKIGRQNISGEGLSRGYFECAGPKGEHISIEKYFVHMKCYQPLESHPFEKQYFDTKNLKPQHKDVFESWLNEMGSPQRVALQYKKNLKKKEVNQEKSRKPRKTKEISKEIKKQSKSK